MYEAGKVGGAPIVAGSEASEMLEATKASLDPVAVLGYDAITKLLAEMSMSHDVNIVESIRLRQIFGTDPNGVRVELNFTGD